MPNERPQVPAKESAPAPKPPEEKAGRSGEGARSVIPHMKADQRARAEASLSVDRSRGL
jgi:hypothetical protein